MQEAAPAAAESFVLVSLTVDGVTAYPLRDLAPLYSDYLARPVTQADLVRIAQAITDKYRADGYFLSRAVVPPQGALPEHARLRVYEGYVGEVEVEGAAAPALRTMLATLPQKRPLKLSDIERPLTLAADLPGVRPRAALEPVLDDPARHRLVVEAPLQRWFGSIYVDNRGTRSAGPDQAQLRVGVNSLLRTGDQLSASVFTAPSQPDAVGYGELAYVVSLNDGSRLRGTLSASRSRHGTTFLNNPAGSESRSATLRYARPLIAGRKRTVWAALGMDARHVEQVYRSGGAYVDELRVVRASLQATEGLAGKISNGFVQISGGVETFGASKSKGFSRSRSDADAGFWKLNASASHYRDLGRFAGVFLSVDGQWAPEPLLLSEEFAPGGLPYGRAYNYGEISGDSGVAGLVEFRVGWEPKLAPLSFVQGYVFADAARTWNHGAGRAGRGDLASAGAGLRLTLNKRVMLRFEAARPLGPDPFETRSGKWRGFFSLWAAI